MNQKKSYSIEDLRTAVSKGECWSDVCRLLNITVCSFNYKRMQSLCLENNIYFKHFIEGRKKAFRRNKDVVWTDDNVFKEKSIFPRSSLRKKVLSSNFLKYECSSCKNNGLWLNKKLTLEIEHVNGINDDNRKENLTWLCPNCHSQTPTFRNSRNRKNQGPVA